VDTELGVAQALRVGLLVLEPQQLERDVLAAFPLAVDLQPIRFGTSWLEFFFAPFEQPLFQLSMADRKSPLMARSRSALVANRKCTRDRTLLGITSLPWLTPGASNLHQG
jgi:hypothetical protein